MGDPFIKKKKKHQIFKKEINEYPNSINVLLALTFPFSIHTIHNINNWKSNSANANIIAINVRKRAYWWALKASL